MKRRIDRALVLGAGTMGARIAAHFANAGILRFSWISFPAHWIPPKKRKVSRWRVLKSAIASRARVSTAALKSRPASFFTPDAARHIHIGNFEDNLNWCAKADWIIEVVAENLEIKRSLLARVEQSSPRPAQSSPQILRDLPVRQHRRRPQRGFSPPLAGHTLFQSSALHEIRGADSRPSHRARSIANARRISATARLGKGVVIAKDTPNFIANRVGTFSVLNAIRLMDELGMTFEEVDACTGTFVGWPKSATFRTADIVGIDVLAHVVRNIYENVPNDESREMYRVPPLIEELLRRGWLGEKSGRGFYQRVKKGAESEILTLDLQDDGVPPAAEGAIRFDRNGAPDGRYARTPARHARARGRRDKVEIKRTNFSGARFRARASTPRAAFPKFPIRSWRLTARCAGDSAGNLGHSKFGTLSASKPWRGNSKRKVRRCRRSSRNSRFGLQNFLPIQARRYVIFRTGERQRKASVRAARSDHARNCARKLARWSRKMPAQA